MIAALVLPGDLRGQIAREAATAHPSECCGLIEGLCDGQTVHAVRCHPAKNRAATADRFEIDPAQHIALLRSLRGTPNSIVGCYHSHPNGKAQPSPRDLESAVDEDFIWLIAAGPQLAAFAYSGAAFHPIRLA